MDPRLLVTAKVSDSGLIFIPKSTAELIAGIVDEVTGAAVASFEARQVDDDGLATDRHTGATVVVIDLKREVTEEEQSTISHRVSEAMLPGIEYQFNYNRR
jgi:hypothetical protein